MLISLVCRGSEALKNLVLGGVASYVVVDGKKVDVRDLGNNFMVDKESLGESRAECCSRLLKEFNESVSGRYIAEHPEQLVDREPDFFKDFTLVIATQLTEPYQIKLDHICRRFGVKAIFGRSYGLFGLVRISTREHSVIETKPENVLQDLRVRNPWPELSGYAKSFDLESLDNMTYKHVPYVVLLLKAAELWRSKHGSLPTDRQAQRSFKQFLRELQRSSKEGFVDEGENFKEAVDNAHYLWSPQSISSEVSMYLDRASEYLESDDVSDFWILAEALKRFVQEGDGNLPLSGSIPDMTATTDLYLDLKRLYEKKAESDVAKMAAHVREILTDLRRDQSEIGIEYIRLFCKNSSHVKHLKYNTVEEEYKCFSSSKSSYLQSLLFSEDTAENAFLYTLFHAGDKFHATHGHFPGYYEEGIQEDIGRLKTIVNATLSEAGLPSVPISEEYIHELCRCGAGEIHTVAAVIGGILAEEAIKLLTHQFVPLNGTLVYNAIRSTSTAICI